MKLIVFKIGHIDYDDNSKSLIASKKQFETIKADIDEQLALEPYHDKNLTLILPPEVSVEVYNIG